MEQRTRKLVEEGFHDKNLVKVLTCRVIPIAAYMMNVCYFTRKELDQLHKGIKKILRENNIHGKQCSDGRLYLIRELGGRGIKSLNDAYTETKVKVACYMTFSSSEWMKEYGNEKLTLKGSQSKRKQKMS